MLKFVHIFKNYYFGLSLIGVLAFVIQEIPYIFMPLVNFIGWAFYYTGHQYGWLIVISQFAVVPLYYLFFGLWKGNYPLVGTATIFCIMHTVNGYMNFIAKK